MNKRDDIYYDIFSNFNSMIVVNKKQKDVEIIKKPDLTI